MTYKYGHAVSPLGVAGDLDALVETGHLAGVLCRLERERFTGAVFVEHEHQSLVWSLRDGQPVFVEDLSGDKTIADEVLERGLITQAQYAEISAQVVEALVESEDVAFCQQAVKLGILQQEQVDRHLVDRLRAKTIQAVPWRDCSIELDDDPDVLAGVTEYPQALGPLLYMGIRTFFEQQDIDAVLGQGAPLFLRIGRPLHEVARYFGLDADERALLSRFDPTVPLSRTIENIGADPLDAKQLVALLVLAQLGELSPTPVAPAAPFFSPESGDQSGVRETRSDAQPAVDREPPKARIASQPERAASPRHAQASAPRARAEREEPASAPQAAAAFKRPQRRKRKLGAALKRLEQLAEPGAAASPRTAPARPASTPRVSSKPQSKRQPSQQQKEQAPSAVAKAAPPQSPAERSHVKQLLLRRRRQITAQSRNVASEKGPLKGEEVIPAVRRLFAAQSFAKALSDLKAAMESEPDNDILKLYALYAELRANNSLEEAALAELKSMLRDYLTHDVHGPFVHLAFGHIMLQLKKEEAAEKYFQKALEMDKSSKDAERHLHLLAVRRKVAAKQEKANKLFGIEINPSAGEGGPTKVFGIEIGKKRGG